MNFTNSRTIDAASRTNLIAVVKIFLAPHASPVFGAAKIVEHEVAALNALKVLGYIPFDADEFDLVEKLRVTKSKARALRYQAALRAEQSEIEILKSLQTALLTTRVLRDGALYLIEVHDPLTMDRLQKRVREAGFISDGSFSGAVAKIPEGALLHLVESLIPDELKEEIIRELIAAGLPDKTIAGALKSMFAQAGRKVGGEVVGQVIKEVGAEIEGLLRNGWGALRAYI